MKRTNSNGDDARARTKINGACTAPTKLLATPSER
jgi:hypothetical protein